MLVSFSCVALFISIHALLAESDQVVIILADIMAISIHALLAESDAGFTFCAWARDQFLSTLSLRRATGQGPAEQDVTVYFYPRSPCGERRRKSWLSCRAVLLISIHALLAESDALISQFQLGEPLFLSTLSLRRATAKVHKTVGHFCAYETNFMEIASSC